MSELGPLIRAKREREGLNLREAGAQSHVAFSTLARIEQGATPSVKVYHAILAWLDGKSPVPPSPPMTMREWFAGMALVGTIMDRASWGVSHTDKAEDFATSAFAIADAMLAESKEPGK